MRAGDIKPGVMIGHLRAIAKTTKTLSSGRRMPAWTLRCVCDEIVVAMTVNITKGKHQSCGCKRSDWIADRYPGDSKKPIYSVYRQMLDRCYLTTAPNFQWYGGKGVTVCDRWRNGADGMTGFQCFEADMGQRPDGLTLERDDPFKPYEPDNCRWATWAEQAANKREHRLPEAERRALRKARSESRTKLTPIVRAAILDRLAAGETQWPIARALGISQSTVSYVKLGLR